MRRGCVESVVRDVQTSEIDLFLYMSNNNMMVRLIHPDAPFEVGLYGDTIVRKTRFEMQ